MACIELDDNGDTGLTAYGNRLLLLALIEALEVRGLHGLSRELVEGLSQSIGKQPQSQLDAISELTDELETIAAVVGLRAGCIVTRPN